MDYIGSKKKLLKFIENTVKKHCGSDISDKVFCDIFAGTGSVGAHFRPMVKQVLVNDVEAYSQLTNMVHFYGYNEKIVRKIVEHLNSLDGTTDYPLYDAYVEGGKCGRLYFVKENGPQLCAARKHLDDIKYLLDVNEYNAALLSIVEAADRVANTMGTYGAFAKKPKEVDSVRKRKLEFKLPACFPEKTDEFSVPDIVFGQDANELIKNIKGDILYLDPPYNTRQYGTYYHVPNAIITMNIPDRETKTGTPKDFYKSEYCSKRTVKAALEQLIEDADFEWVFLSYNNEGLLSFKDIKEIFKKHGDYFVEATEHQRYKADNNREQKAEKTYEYLHILHKGVYTNTDDTEDPVEKMTVITKLDNKVSEWDDFGAEIEGFTFDMCFDPAVEEPGITETKVAKRPKSDIVVSPMNYMGGKKKLLNDLLGNFPKDVKVFIDLFCGGATVGINSEAEWVLFNDNIVPLIEMYKFMKNNSVEDCLHYIDFVIGTWGLTQNKDDEDKYYSFRENYNSTPVEERNPLDLFVLMAFSFNNQIRFAINKNWKFNIPFGANRSSFNDKMRENLIGFINALHNRDCFFMSVDFRDVPVDKETFVYADPPYLISQATYNDGWDEDSEKDLLAKLKELDDIGGRFALSNVLENKGKENTILKEWAEENGYNIVHLNRSYANSYYHRKEKESKTDEVLITNYKLDNNA